MPRTLVRLPRSVDELLCVQVILAMYKAWETVKHGIFLDTEGIGQEDKV